MIYKTVSGDTWDVVAKKTLGSEYLLDVLMDINPEHREIVIFPANVLINIPEIEEDEINNAPPWLRD